MTTRPHDEAELVDQLATRLNRVGLSRFDPARYLEERDDIVVQLRRLAKRLRGESGMASTTTWRAPGGEPREAGARGLNQRTRNGLGKGR